MILSEISVGEKVLSLARFTRAHRVLRELQVGLILRFLKSDQRFLKFNDSLCALRELCERKNH